MYKNKFDTHVSKCPGTSVGSADDGRLRSCSRIQKIGVISHRNRRFDGIEHIYYIRFSLKDKEGKINSRIT